MNRELTVSDLDVLPSMSLDENEMQPTLHVVRPHPQIADDSNMSGERSTLSDSSQVRLSPPLPHIRPAIRLPDPGTSFRTLQAWEGVVTAVRDDAFAVRLMDLMNDMPDEEADVSFEEVSSDEKQLVKVGAVFLLHVGYATSEGGQLSRKAILRFRRLPVWTDAELATAGKVAQKQANAIRWR